MVHDWEGAGRSAVLIVAHIMKSRQITYDAAVEIVRKTRPGISIEDAYEAELLQLEQDLHLRAAKSRTTAIGQAHSAGADFSDYDSDMDDAKAFDERAEDSSSSDEFLDEFGSDEDNEDELENEYYYEDDDGSHFWGYESHDDEESESSESVVSDTFDSNALTIGRNGNPIMGDAADMVVSTEGAAFELVFYDGTQGWRIITI